MTTFTIDAEDNITAFPSPGQAEASVGAGAQPFTSQHGFAELAGAWPEERLVAIWNSLPGVVPVKKFKSAKMAVTRIWTRIQGLGAQSTPGKPGRKAKVLSTPGTGKPGKEATPSKKKPQSKKRATNVQENAGPREGSKTAKVVAMLQRKNGATLPEIMDKMGWQKHTVRGFMAGAMRKAGFTIESFKPEGGERTYRINQ